MKIKYILFAILSLALFGSCKKLSLQKNYKFNSEGTKLDPNINKTALQYLMQRGKSPANLNDTIFKYMQLGLEYAELDLSEYSKAGRTFILLSNNAIRVLPTTTATVNGVTVVTTTSNVPTGGMWFDFPIMEKNPDGSQKFAADGISPITHPAKSWTEYSKQTVKNYFLSLIIQADYGFNNAITTNTSMPTLLPAGAVAGTESKLGYIVSGTTPNFTPGNARIITVDYINGGKGFDPESKINMKIVNSDYSPLMVNDITTVATGGLIATNGQIHVCSTTTYPFRY